MRIALLLAAGWASVLACNNPSGGNTCKSIGADVTIDVGDQGGFSPNPVTITAGQRVCWENVGTITHTVTTLVPATDSINEALPPNAVFDHTFSRKGADVNYYCAYHQQTEQGLIQVR